MNKIEESLSQSKYAEHRNVTKGYIGRLVKKGRLPLIKGKLYESNVPWSDYSGNHLQINLDSNP
jgi:hypothetical protein